MVPNDRTGRHGTVESCVAAEEKAHKDLEAN